MLQQSCLFLDSRTKRLILVFVLSQLLVYLFWQNVYLLPKSWTTEKRTKDIKKAIAVSPIFFVFVLKGRQEYYPTYNFAPKMSSYLKIMSIVFNYNYTYIPPALYVDI